MEKNYQCRVVGRESDVGGSTYLCGPGESKRELNFFDEAIVLALVQDV